MISLDVRADVREVTRYLNRVERQQVPFATALALTRTAQDASKEETRQLPIKLDRPTPFTLKAMGYLPASKSRLVSTVFVRDIQAAYLGIQIEGGAKQATGRGFGVPYKKNKKLNKYGNIAGRRSGLVKGKNQFVATIRGVSGVYERVGKKRDRHIRLLVAFEPTTKYKPIFPFYKIAEGVARSRFGYNFRESMHRALSTAR